MGGAVFLLSSISVHEVKYSGKLSQSFSPLVGGGSVSAFPLCMDRGVVLVCVSLRWWFQCVHPRRTAYCHWLPGDSLCLFTAFQGGLPALGPSSLSPLTCGKSVWGGVVFYSSTPWPQLAKKKKSSSMQKILLLPGSGNCNLSSWCVSL